MAARVFPRPISRPPPEPHFQRRNDHVSTRNARRPADRLSQRPDRKEPGPALAEPAGGAAPRHAVTPHPADRLEICRYPPAPDGSGQVDADRKGGAPRAGAGKSGPRARKHAGDALDLYRHAANPAEGKRAEPQAQPERGALRHRGPRWIHGRRRRAAADGEGRSHPHPGRSVARTRTHRLRPGHLARRARPADDLRARSLLLHRGRSAGRAQPARRFAEPLHALGLCALRFAEPAEGPLPAEALPLEGGARRAGEFWRA